MESVDAVKISIRLQALSEWLARQCQLQVVSIEPMVGDASFRRYFRVHTEATSYVAMDAPPALEDCRPFIAIANALRQLGLKTPGIIQVDVEQGFLLLTDFGDLTYLKALTPQTAEKLYHRAFDALAVIQSCRSVEGYKIPIFSAEFMQQEWAWHKEWFLEKHLGLSLIQERKNLDACYDQLVQMACLQPQVFIHRDYHSANLMVLPADQVGLLDFQDAMCGPVTYDLVSLLRDCYIDWDKAQVNQWALAYYQKLHALNVLPEMSASQFLMWFDWMGVQRHLKALFTFSRKYLRDQQAGYLRHIPRTLNYVLSVTACYPELEILHSFYQNVVLPAQQSFQVSRRGAPTCVP